MNMTPKVGLSRFFVTKAIVVSLAAIVCVCTAPGGAIAADGLWVHPLCQSLPIDRNGPFVAMPDGGLVTVDAKGLRTSTDDGKTWSEPQPVCEGLNPGEPASFYLLRAKSGALVLVYLDMANYKFDWDEAAGEPKEGTRLEMWAIRSLDGGKTWIDRQRLLDGYNANFFGLIQTQAGGIVVTAEHLVSNPGRWVACSFRSGDDGKTWKRSNLIDLGGHGHHDGATEPTLAELSDGRVLMLIRTNLDRFWQAFSEDDGQHWRTIQPSSIDASSSPGHLVRLASGRLVLVWNRLNPEGGTAAKSGPSAASEAPMSWYRGELSIAFSDDDAKSWTKPIVLARNPKQLSYPYVFERRPGELWVFAGFGGPLRLRVDEQAFLQEANKN
jgi:hypothetical protein